MRAKAVALLAALAAGSGMARAEAPLSAIDWLSDSVAAPQDLPAPGADVATTAAPGAIEVSPLDAPIADATGLLPPSATGLPRALWGSGETADILAAINAVPRDLLPGLRALFTTILLAEANAPVDTDDTDRLLLARVDRLLDMGALDRAEALLARAGPETPDRFRRYFDIALLQGTENEACARMRARPEISPTYPARIFCLARAGDWPAAAVTLETATSLGILTFEEDLLLARFLDAEIEGDAGLPEVTPLTFRMTEAIGEPVPTTTLPLAFAWADLRPTRGWKAQVEAAERLARNDVLSGNQLVGLYLRQRPSASGMVWDRVAAIQKLQEDLASGAHDDLARDLPEVWAAMMEAGLDAVFADQYGAELARLPLSGPAADLALAIGLRSPAYEEIALAATAADPRRRFLLALARGLPETAVAPDAMSAAVREGFLPRELSPAFRLLLAEGRVGEAILKAIRVFSEGAEGDPDGVSDAIALLRDLGLQTVARRAALELLLQDGAA